MFQSRSASQEVQGLEPLTLQTPSMDHVQFDQICAEVDDFEPLPALSGGPLEYVQASEEEAGLDDQILAGLVTQVYYPSPETGPNMCGPAAGCMHPAGRRRMRRRQPPMP